ncbi:MAG: protein-disulfide reductase DsbD [Gammaproteobacteria bacterium]|nr:protein-disulfide reductase DsbD [Gammaproteobacteria bacterium]MBT8111854.1 protein-disulfide reductase DsbD [Gammaproteobacteria bacterium]NND48498.1 protein-disulfide reductase DsbD [Woeseiaceae bacterium]NNL46553.1 protein-disulfide reductase DsbD [Woeseiaceae bacterium]
MTKIGNGFAALLLAFCPAIPAFADEAPPKVTEAFQYVVSDTGAALEIDWAIDECCYLYRDKLSFESGDGALAFGDFQLPEGLPHEDEFFGKQQVYRDRFFVTIPYTVKGDRPQTAELVIKSQGCNDVIGICYPPQTWTDEVKLRKVSAGPPKLKLGQFGDTANISSEFPPVDEVFFPEVFPVDGNAVEVGIRVVPGFYLYKDKISVRSLTDGAKAGRLDLPKGKMKVDEYFGEMEVYLDSIVAPLAIARATPNAMDIELELKYQGCAEGGLCYMPQTRVIAVSLPEASTISDLSALPSETAPVSEQARLAQIITGSSIWVTIGLFFLAGLGLAFTPCVLPMVPILSGIIAGEGDEVTPMRGFTLASSYVLGMALVYTAAGIVAAAAGLQLQATFNQPWILILFAGLFVILALGMFGAYELQMPSSIQGKVSSVSGKQRSGTMIGAFVMGALSALIVTACVAPALIAALTVMAQTGDMLRSGSALFAMSLGMGAPLLLVGAAQGKLLPKAGPWMVAVRNAFGFMMLGLAIWMLSRILSGNITMLLWAVLIFMGGVFMGGLTTLTGESAVVQKLGKGFGFLAIIYGIVLLLGALTGGSNPLQPLASINLGGATTVAEAEHALPFQRIKTVDDLDRELAAASSQGKSAFLDFYADWCVSCKEMEAYTFTDGDVQAALSNTVWLQADVTANDDADQALLSRFGVFGPPTIIFFGTDGQQRHGYEVVGYMKARDFVEHLQLALGESASISAQARHE